MSQDREFEKYLQGSSTLTKLYAEMPDAELPTHLDAAILAEAHRAVDSRPGAQPNRRWTIPLGLVATLFLAVMIGLQVPFMLKEAASPQQRHEEKIAAMMDTGIAEQPSAAPETDKKIQKRASVRPQEKSEIIRAEPAIEAAEAIAPVRLSAPVVVSPRKSVVSESNSLNGVLMAPAAPLATPGSPAPLPEKPLGFSGSEYIGHDQVLAKEKKSGGLVQDKPSDALEQQAPAAVMAAPQSVLLNRALVQPMQDEAVDTSLPPHEWLDRIIKLKQVGKLDEARKELTAFKKRYPDFPVPVTLEIK